MDVQPPFFSLDYLALHPDAAGIAISAVLAIASWVVNAKLARKLQRKQLAIEIICKYLSDKHFVDHVQRVYKIINSDPGFDWKGLATKRYGKGTYAPGEQEISDSLVTVLNHKETVAIAILNNAVDENILKWSQRLIILRVNTETKPFIDETRRLIKSDHAWCNFVELAERWKKDDKKKHTAGPKD